MTNQKNIEAFQNLILRRVLKRQNYPFSMDMFPATWRVLKNILNVSSRTLILNQELSFKIKTTTGKSNFQTQKLLQIRLFKNKTKIIIVYLKLTNSQISNHKLALQSCNCPFAWGEKSFWQASKLSLVLSIIINHYGKVLMSEFMLKLVHFQVNFTTRVQIKLSQGTKEVKIDCINVFICMLMCVAITFFNVIGSKSSKCF